MAKITTSRQELKTFVDEAQFCLGVLLTEADDDPFELVLEYLEELADAQHDSTRRNLARRMRDQVMIAVRLGIAGWMKYGAFDELIDSEMEVAQ